jgi:hypothetical protein
VVYPSLLYSLFLVFASLSAMLSPRFITAYSLPRVYVLEIETIQDEHVCRFVTKTSEKTLSSVKTSFHAGICGSLLAAKEDGKIFIAEKQKNELWLGIAGNILRNGCSY